MTDTTPEPWAVYCRISYVRRVDGQVDTLGVDRQRPPAEKLVEARGGYVEHVYVDNDTSAFSGKRREEYEEMLTGVREGRIRGIAAWAADRLTRRPVENEELIALAERCAVKLATVTGEHDLSTPAGRLHFRMLGSIARYESEHKSQRIRLKRDEQAAAGKPHGGGHRPFGFKADMVTHDPEEAELLRNAARDLLDGVSMWEILHDWKDLGVPSDRPAPHTTVLRRVLLAPRIAGLRQHRGAVVGDAVWDAIIPPAQWERLKALFSGRDRQQIGAPSRTLLGGIAKCVCGMSLRGGVGRVPRGGTGKGTDVYRCVRASYRDACGKISITRSHLDTYIVALLLDRLAGPGLAKMIASLAGDDPDHAALAAQAAADDEELAELEKDRYLRKDAAGRPMVSPAAYPALRDELQRRIDAARRAQRPRPEARVLMDLQKFGDKLAEAWHGDKIPLEVKRTIVRTCLPEITIFPADRHAPRKFDPEARVSHRWVDQRPDVS